MKKVFIDSFSSSIIKLDKKDRTDLNVLSVLQKDSTISTFDMTEKWKGGQEVWEFVSELIQRELITEEKSSYPWHKYKLTKKGEELISLP
jgi:predicted transcriptional regulator